MTMETSRHLDTLKSDEWAQDQSIILDAELRNNKKKGAREGALFRQEISRRDVGHLAMGTESCKESLLSSYRIIALEAVLR